MADVTKDKPILFSAPMVRALLAGTKTQTRRVMKPWPGMQSAWLRPEVLHAAPSCYLITVDGHLGAQFQHPLAGQNCDGIAVDAMSPLTWVRLPYAPSVRLWVREAWRAEHRFNDLPPRDIPPGENIQYLADNPISPWGARYRPAMHMPRWASRLTLTVTEVRVQRLQDISEADATDEGIERLKSGRGFYDPTMSHGAVHAGHYFTTAKDAYRALWNSIHGQYAWHGNPWVRATTFTVAHGNIDQVQP